MHLPSECFMGHTQGEICNGVVEKLYIPLGFEIGKKEGDFVIVYPPDGWIVHPSNPDTFIGPNGAFLKKGLLNDKPTIISHFIPNAIIYQN